MKRLLMTLPLMMMTMTAFARPGSAWLEIGPGGRAAALAEAVTASVDGATATYWNPAAMDATRNRVEIMQNSWWVEGGSSQYVSGTFPSGKMVFGASAMHVGFSDLQLRDRPSASAIGTFDARNYSLGLSASGPIGKGFRVGASLHYLNETIYVDQASGWSGDIGVLRRGLLGGSLDLGAALRHLGRIEALRTTAYDLPTTFAVGGLYRLPDLGIAKPAVMVDVAKVRDYDPSVHLGAEVGLFQYLALRAGYASGYDARGLTGGFGVEWDRWRFDYGYTPFRDDLGAAQRFSVAVSW